jgi:hypothetical protein
MSFDRYRQAGKVAIVSSESRGGHFVRFVAKARCAVVCVAAIGASTFSSKAQASDRKFYSR